MTYQNSQDEQRARWRRRDHANIEAMQNRIIQRVTEETGVMMPPKVRAFISALQSAHGGGEVIHEPFKRSHLTVANYLQFTGTDTAKAARVRRLIDALEKYQQQAGVMFFHITRGGEVVRLEDGSQTHTTTEYIDLLKPIADRAVMLARESELWKQHPGKALDAQVEQAQERLVRCEPETASEEMNDDPFAFPFDVRLARNRKHAISRACANFALLKESHGDIIAHAESLANEIRERAYLIAQAEAAEEGGRVTNLLPSPAETLENTEEISKVDAALIYAGRGWRVFPCKAKGKTPIIKEWQKRATTDPAQIVRWWEQWPDANVAIATGEASGIIAIDVDPRHGGDGSLRELIEAHEALPETAVVATGGGGFHPIFLCPKDTTIKNSVAKLGAGIDVRGSGGYIIAPPSVHESGKVYEWLRISTLAPLPDWLLKLLTEKPISNAARGEKERSEAQSGAAIEGLITEGGRNDTLFRRVASVVAGRGASYEEIERAVIEANEQHCSPPLDVSECRKIARSAHTLETRKGVAVGA